MDNPIIDESAPKAEPGQKKGESDDDVYLPVINCSDGKWIIGPDGIDSIGIPDIIWKKALLKQPCLEKFKTPSNVWAIAKLCKLQQLCNT